MARARTESTPARWITVGTLAVFGVAVAVLVGLALQHTSPAAAPGTPGPVPTFSFGTGSSQGPTPSGAPPANGGPTDSGPERFLSIGSDSWWRATGGGCGADAPVLERSVDDGVSWTDVTPLYRGVTSILGLDAFGGSEAEIVAGVGDACSVEALRTFTQGEYWQAYEDLLAVSSYIEPQTSVVTLSSGDVAAPCATPHGLRTSGSQAAVVCDGVAFARDAAVGDWVSLADSAAAVAVDESGVVVANSTPGCAGLTLTRFADGTTESATALGCAPTGSPATSPVAIDITAEGIAVWSGDGVTITP